MHVHRSLVALGAALLFSLSAFQASAATEPLDIDASGTTRAATDGMLVLRYLFGMRGTALVQGALDSGAARSTVDIESHLAGLAGGAPPALDIDGNGAADALTDGLLVYRYLTGLRGQALVQGLIGAGASRSESGAVETYLATLTSSTPPVAPTGCAIVASPTSSSGAPLVAGTSVQLTANCTGGTQPITYTWDSGAFAGAVRTVAPGVTTTYSVVASNAAGAASAVTSTVYITAGAQNLCAGSDEIRLVNFTAATGQLRLYTDGFANQIVAFKFTVPAGVNSTHTGVIAIAESPGQPVGSREITVSKNSCDFSTGSYLWNDIGAGDTAPSFSFSVGNPGGIAQVNFQVGDVIYVNIRNALNGVPSCSAAACDILFDFASPNRY